MRVHIARRRSARAGLFAALAAALISSPAQALPLLSFSVTTPPAAGDPVLLGPGEDLEVDVVISGLGESGDPSVAGWELTVGFDPSLLDLSAVTVNSGVGSPVGPPLLQTVDTSTPGELSVLFVSSVVSPAFFAAQPDGFVLFSLAFEAVDPGSGALSFLDPVDVSDPDGELLAVGASSRGVIVSAAPEAGALGLLAAALGAAAAGGRRRA
jgi:hypothetical protein